MSGVLDIGSGLAAVSTSVTSRDVEAAVLAERERVLEIFEEQFSDCTCESCGRGRVTVRRIREGSAT